MRVLLTHRPGGAYGYISDGWFNALKDRGHAVQRWDGNESSWFDFKPDLYVGCSGHKQSIPKKHNSKIALHVNSYGPVVIQGINESQNDINWVLQQKPNIVFGYGHEEDRVLWSYWTTKHGIPWIPSPTAGDRTIFKQFIPGDQKSVDVVYLGGRWPYKALTIDAYLVPLLTGGKISFKLHGWGDWPAGVNSGALGDDQANQFLNIGKIGPCIAEQHTHSYGIDIPERAFKVALCGALVVHDPAMTVKRMIPSALIATNPKQFQDWCLYYAKPEASTERIELIKKQQQEVLVAHTYHHRIAAFLDATGFKEEAKGMLNG